MIAPNELLVCPIFTCLDDAERQRFAERAADVRLQDGEWLIREGETPSFFISLAGQLQLVKNLMGRDQELHMYKPGDFFGEVPILLGAPSFAAVRARSSARVARFDAQQLFELVQSSAACSAVILQTMMERLNSVQRYAKELPSARVLLVGKQYDEEEQLTVIVDREYCVESPTIRTVAEALGIRTTPKYTNYDVVVVGAGPAGLAAGVYGASEGLKVLVVEKAAAGGQAGTSSRIENYLGFPNGISGDELSERALKQAARFGAEIAMTRQVEKLEALEEGGYCVQMDGGQRVSACVVLLATGVEWRILKAEGVDRLQGRGVLYGASRNEASNVVGKRVFIVGGGNSAGQAAVFFSNYAEEVTVLVRRAGLELTMSQYLIEQMAKKGNIHIEPYTEIVAAEGEDHLELLKTRTHVPGKQPTERTCGADALFVMIGADASTAWLPAELQRDQKGYICTGQNVTTWKLERDPFPLETNLPGVFCAGDVRHDSIKRVSSGVGEGSMAIAFIHQYLALQNF
jgi:thioredoxin reductase (NADPH)